jgi:hypothetical protein
MLQLKIFILPSFAKRFGFLIILIGVVLTILQLVSGVHASEFFNPSAAIEIYSVFAITLLGCVIVIFSKEKFEDDEYINLMRLKAFMFSVAFHALFFFIFSFTSLTLILISFPAIVLMDSLLLVYIMSFYYQKIKNR